MRWFETDGVVLRYAVRHGKGPYLVLVHEMGGSIESWDRVLTHLPPEQGVVLPEMRGMGQSQKIRETSSFGQIAADVAALLDHLEIADPVVISGCAIGGAVALRFALDHPARCLAVAPLDPALNVAEGGEAGILALADQMEAKGMTPMEPILLDRTYPERYRRRHPGHFAEVRGRWYANDPVSFAHFFRMLAASDLRPELARMRCPVWYGSGLHDLLRPPGYVRDLAARTPGAQVRDLDAGHHVADHAPQEVAQMLSELVTSVRRQSEPTVLPHG
ncbi:alpha/beta hydrolase [Salipiger sp. P9]|uniref:alpha/beta fold hydrolase n=1 Tax=Salipiger pentaromativorans TaxID=2943193 RepID=UPI0021585A83|nr:alpha/beta hydrolase [Salipiger pentaromativorans]MCR8551032.1 alpha/beta hydrolase [Salipiger pentaromativorans]